MANRLTDKIPPKASGKVPAKTEKRPDPMLGATVEDGMPAMPAKAPKEPAAGVKYADATTLGGKNLKGACSFLKGQCER